MSQMTAPLSPEQVESGVKGALAWDLSRPMKFLVIREGIPAERVEVLAREYRRYMACVVTTPSRKLPISNAVDVMWHAHLLFTQDYMAMSRFLRGAYIDHVPTLTEDERAALEPHYFEGTLTRYRELFGDPPKEFWPSESASICWSCT